MMGAVLEILSMIVFFSVFPLTFYLIFYVVTKIGKNKIVTDEKTNQHNQLVNLLQTIIWLLIVCIVLLITRWHY